MLEVLDAESVRRWVVVTRAALAARRAEIDALNVYPVPDGDTGTNMYLTLDQALDTARTEQERLGVFGLVPLPVEAAALSRAALMSARGNSGVILSQMIRGVSEVVSADGLEAVDADAVVRAVQQGAQRARESVVRPQEGTILSVADATAERMAAVRAEGGCLGDLTRAAVDAARAALTRTPEQLQVLADAGVVDAGGAGYLLFVEALDQVVHELGLPSHFAVDEFTLNTSLERRADWSRAQAEQGSPQVHEGPAYEVMYLLHDVDEGGVATLRQRLDEIGDSVVVSTAEDVCHVHVHTDDIGAALEAGLTHAAPQRVAVTLLETVVARPRVGVSIVACAAGPGIAALLEEAGATTVTSGPGHRASAGEIVAAVRAAGTEEVILLPNDRDTRMAADAAARAAEQEGQTVHVIPSATAVQGLAALAVFEPGETTQQNVLTMTRSAAATRHGAVTVAVKAGLTSGGLCEVGDVLGVVSGDITIVGSDAEQVTREVLDGIVTTGTELVTLVSGEGVPDGLVEAITDWIGSRRAGIEVEVVDGGQPHYMLLVGAE
ncbi:DAK2 domain-containing protein [Janibacter anophelis]|uniref:DAK2 domain-containing protein n=1 Tax=Janibacter anophelis TaxID=319054 RepID=UPI000DEEABC9|nr:DAK2 domain-containing protein [Janibacter anophelis]